MGKCGAILCFLVRTVWTVLSRSYCTPVRSFWSLDHGVGLSRTEQVETTTHCSVCDRLFHTKCVERRAPQHRQGKPSIGSGGSSKRRLDHQAEAGGVAFVCPKVRAFAVVLGTFHVSCLTCSAASCVRRKGRWFVWVDTPRVSCLWSMTGNKELRYASIRGQQPRALGGRAPFDEASVPRCCGMT